MKNIKNHFGIKQTLTLALVASMLVQTFIGVMPAFATQEPSTASVNIGVTPLHVSGGASILANVTVNINNNADNWNSTGVYIGTSAPADLTPYICNDTTDHDTPGVYTEGLSIKAPNEAGTYTAYFLISKNGSDCKGNINNVVIRPTAGPIVVDTPAIFSLAYDGNGNTSGVVPSSATGYSGATVIVASYGDLVNANHTFISWNTKAGGDGANYAVGSEFTISGDATLYAKWEENPKYRLTYDANGGTGAGPLHQDEYVNTVVILNDENALKMANHTFDGWNTKADGTGTQYAAGDSYTITADVTLYAHWKEDNKYTLSYDDNGSTSGSGTAPASVSGYEDADIDVSDQGSLLKTNWTFVGWNTAVDGSGDSYDAGDEFKIGSSNAILYAQWEENEKYTLSYDGNDSTGGTAPVSAEYYEGQSVTVSGKGDLVKTGQTFDGWNTKANGSGTNYAAGSSITISGDDVTLYAKWKEATQFTLTYNSNGSTSGTAPVGGSYYDNESVAVSGKGDLARIGYSFTVWNTKADGTGANYVVASNITLTSDLTLYAKWTINSYTITFSSNGGTVIGSKTQDYGTAVTAPAAPTRLGYTFAGWDKVIPSTMPAYSQTIVAQWTANNYTIYFDEAGGSTVPDITQAYGTAVTAPVNPTRTGFAFAGWLPLVPAAMPAYNQTLTAQWANILVTVTYVAGTGGTISGANTQTINYGANTTAVTATPSTGYTFEKWSDGLTTATRSDLDVTASKTVTATFKATGEVKGATTDESDVAGATDNANCACWCSCHLFLGISWCWWILIIIIVLAIIIWRVIVAIERRREEE